METNAVSEHDRMQKLVDTMTSCLAELDSIDAHVAGAHLDAALQALRRQFELARNISNPD
jgi:flagellar biosynthesis regulator FlbT